MFSANGNKYLFALPIIKLFSYKINFILRIFPAMQIGIDAYPPIPKIIEGRLKTKNISDLKIEYKMKKNEKNH